MADNPLDGWQATLAADQQHVGSMPSGPVKNLLNKKLRDMDYMFRAVEASPDDESFLDRVQTLARRMKETQLTNTQEPADIWKEFAACAKIARTIMRAKAARDAKLASQGLFQGQEAGGRSRWEAGACRFGRETAMTSYLSLPT